MDPPDLEDIKRRYAAMTPEQFASLRREDLTELGQTAYDLECTRRDSPEWAASEARKDEEYARQLEEEARALRGIAGWLTLPALGLLIGPIRQSLAVYGSWTFLSSERMRSLEGQIAGLGSLALGEVILGLAFLGFTIFVAFLFFSKSSLTPSFVVVLLLLNVTGSIGLYAWGNSVLGPAVQSELEGDTVLSVFAAAVWIPYFLRSRRVKNTFVRKPHTV